MKDLVYKILILIFFSQSTSGYPHSSCKEVVSEGMTDQSNQITVSPTDQKLKLNIQKVVQRMEKVLKWQPNTRIDFSKSEFEIGGQYYDGEISVRSPEKTDFINLTSLIVHEYGHAFFDENMKIFFRGRVATFQNHRKRLKDAIQFAIQNGKGEELRRLYSDSYRLDGLFIETMVYQELLGDLFAAYFNKDPNAVSRILLDNWNELSDSQKQEILETEPRYLDLVELRTFSIRDYSEEILFESNLAEMYYRELNLVRPFIWSILEKLPEKDFPIFVKSFIMAAERHRKIYRRVPDWEFQITTNYKRFLSFNEKFRTILNTALLENLP
jgi:hypothetical protein